MYSRCFTRMTEQFSDHSTKGRCYGILARIGEKWHIGLPVTYYRTDKILRLLEHMHVHIIRTVHISPLSFCPCVCVCVTVITKNYNDDICNKKRVETTDRPTPAAGQRTCDTHTHTHTRRPTAVAGSCEEQCSASCRRAAGGLSQKSLNILTVISIRRRRMNLVGRRRMFSGAT